MKTCTKCKASKPVDQFGKQARSRDGLYPHCRDCRAVDRVAYYEANREEIKVRTRRWREANPEHHKRLIRAYAVANHERLMTRDRERRYRLPDGGLSRLIAEQSDACAACAEPFGKDWSKVHVDHDHACCPGTRSCGKCIRGVICASCNWGLGKFGDDPAKLRSAADYLDRHRSITMYGDDE